MNLRLSLVLVSMLAVSLGCGNPEPAPAPPSGMATEGSGTYEKPSGAATGTREEHEPAKMGQVLEEEHDEHEHVHEPMFGGKLVELGDHAANMEVVFAKEEGRLTIYTLDAHAENPIRIAAPSIEVQVTPPGVAPITLSLAAVESVLTGETLGDTAKFEIIDERLKGLDSLVLTVPKLDLKGMVFEAVQTNIPG